MSDINQRVNHIKGSEKNLTIAFATSFTNQNTNPTINTNSGVKASGEGLIVKREGKYLPIK